MPDSASSVGAGRQGTFAISANLKKVALGSSGWAAYAQYQPHPPKPSAQRRRRPHPAHRRKARNRRPKLDYAAAVRRSHQVADRLVKGVGFHEDKVECG
jgi:hypothetical protein